MTQFIEIVISPNGQSTIETKGFNGASCRDASRFVEDALGSLLNERLSPEFYLAKVLEQTSNQRHES